VGEQLRHSAGPAAVVFSLAALQQQRTVEAVAAAVAAHPQDTITAAAVAERAAT